jgi:hypothetical protein
MKQNGFVAVEKCFVARGGNQCLTNSAGFKKSPADDPRGARAYVPVHSTRVVQLTRFQVCPPQNMPPKAQPCTRSEFVPFIAMVES